MRKAPLISIRKTTNELERLEEFGRSAVTCYWEAIDSTDHYAIEFNAERVAQFRAKLQVLKQQLRDAGSTEQLKSVQALFDTEVKEFQRRVRDHLEQLRREVAAATAAVGTFTSTFNQSGADLEAGVKRELQQLNKVAASDDIQEIRSGIRAATAKITTDVGQMRSCNQLAIVQLKEEIRLLHQEIQGIQRSLRPQSEEQTPARQHVNSRMEELARRGRPFSVLLAVVKNVEGLLNCHSRKVLENGLNTFKARLENSLPASATVACWNKDQFVAVLDMERVVAIATSRDVIQTLSKPIVEEADGILHTLVFEVATGVIDFKTGADPQEFQTKTTQFLAALAGRPQ
jgi:GGDEF domain-containing protein